MTKILKLESISYKQKRAKFEGDIWLTVSPFVNLDSLQFGQDYQLEVVMDKNNLWYVDSMTPAVPERMK